MSIITAALFTIVLGQNAPAAKPEPVEFRICKRLVGGIWRGKLPNGMPVDARYQLAENGKLIVGRTMVGDPKKPAVVMESKIGIEAGTNRVFYVDFHGKDTLYVGFIMQVGDKLEFDFRGQLSDTNHYLAVESVSPNRLTSTLFHINEFGDRKEMHGMVLERKSK